MLCNCADLVRHVGGADRVPSCFGLPGATGPNEDRAFNGKTFHAVGAGATAGGGGGVGSHGDGVGDDSAEAMAALAEATAAAEAEAKAARPAKVVAL